MLLALTTFLQIGHADSVDDLVQQEMNAHRFPGDGLAVIVLTNTDEMVAGSLARKVAPFYFGQRKEH